MQAASDLLIGAHTSTQGGLENALHEGARIGATTVQIFTSNQRQWKGRVITDEIVDAWNHALKETGIRDVMSHASYLINLGSPAEDTFAKSQKAFAEEIQRCTALDLAYLNFHPGAYLKDLPENALDRIVSSLLEFQELLEGSRLRLLLEATAGQGSTLGRRFEELAYIIERVEGKLPIGVCIDTCHIFAAGYDLRSVDACEATLDAFDKVVGLQHLYAFHLNDSAGALGSRKDRHRDLGQGEIGLDCFRFLMSDPRTRELPKYLETPGRLEIWAQEIQMLREFADDTSRS